MLVTSVIVEVVFINNTTATIRLLSSWSVVSSIFSLMSFLAFENWSALDSQEMVAEGKVVATEETPFADFAEALDEAGSKAAAIPAPHR